VVALGKNLKRELQVGDKVAGSVHGGLFRNKGAFAEFLKVESDLCFKVPGNLPMEDAASFGIPWFTAGHVSLRACVRGGVCSIRRLTR
jgi:NADPH:quinone reductase-like Zn-dependent oxidoreductase